MSISKTLRALILYRDGDHCYICNKKLNKTEISLDHLIPRSSGGKDCLSNLKVCCKTCNQIKSNRPYSNKTIKYVRQERKIRD